MMPDLLDRAPCGYFSFYDDGTLCAVNETLCAWLGYAKEEPVGKNVESLFTLPTRIFYQTHFFPLVKMSGGAEEIFATLLTKTGGQLPVLLNAKREPGSRPLTACIAVVVANRQKFEDELIAARRQAEKALRENTALQEAKQALQKHAEQLDEQYRVVKEQNHELRQLHHALTHSLKEPLRKMLLYTEMMQHCPLPADAAQSLAKLGTASLLMKNIVTGLQQYVWLDDVPAVFAPVSLSGPLQAAATRVRQQATGEELILQAETLPLIEGDKERIELLFYHVLSNAVKFKKGPAACVTVTASLIQQNRFTALTDKYRYDDFVKLEIADKGIGFDTAAAETVFDLFRKLHTGNGSGLGLALCKKIVDNHRGSISAGGSVGEGVTITVILPVKQDWPRPPGA